MDTPTRQRAPPARSQGEEEEGYPPKLQRVHQARAQGREGATRPGSALPQRAARKRRKWGTPPNLSVHTLRTECRRGRGGDHLNQMGKGGHPPSSVRALRTACRREREGGPPTKRWKKMGHPPSTVRSSRTACQVGRGGTPNEGGGGTPQTGAHALRSWPDTRYRAVPKTCRGPTQQEEAVWRGQEEMRNHD